MTIGNGDIASVIKEFDYSLDRVYFASGVSNSQETDEEEYRREVKLLAKQDQLKHLVYFSTLAVFYGDTRYVEHKRKMENLVKDNFKTWTIVRLGNITWGKNPNTIINYFRKQIKAKRPLVIKDEYRYIIDKEEFIHWMKMIPDWSCEMNITGKRMKVQEIVDTYGYRK